MGLRRSFWFPFFGVPQRCARQGRRPCAAESGGAALRDDGGAAWICSPTTTSWRWAAGLRCCWLSTPGMSTTSPAWTPRRSRWAWLASVSPSASLRARPRSSLATPWRCPGRTAASASIGSLNCLKFVPDPSKALREMARVLGPGGRAVLTLDPPVRHPERSGKANAFGEWQWSADDARRMMEEAGFADVSVGRAPTRMPMQLLRGVKRAAPVAEAVETPALAAEAVG